jgi:replicative DNA helicase
MTDPQDTSTPPPEENGTTRRAARDEQHATRQPGQPWSSEAELGLLSCLVCDPANLIPTGRTRVPADAFYHRAHETLYRRIIAMVDERQPLDLITLTNVLREKKELDAVGGVGAVSELVTYAVVSSHWEHYMKIVQQKYALRRTIALAQKVMQRAHTFGQGDQETDATEVLVEAETQFFDLMQETAGSEAGKGFVDSRTATDQWLEHMDQVIANRGRITGLTTGIHELDLTFHGLLEQELIVIAGRPAMGKTAMAVTIADHMAVEHAWPGLIFSAEMNLNEIYTRLVLGRAGIDTKKGISGMVGDPEKPALAKAASEVRKAPLFTNESSAMTTADLRAQVMLAKRKHGIRWIMVDHLHLIKGVTAAAQKDERMKLVEVMETLHFIKKEFNVLVILLVQMNREADHKAGQPPVLADLAGSAAIEQFANHVVFIHRPDEYVKWHRLKEDAQDAWRSMILPRRQRSPDLWSDGLAYADEEGGYARQDYEEQSRLYVRKNRRGATPELQVRYQKTFTRFSTRMPVLYSTNPLDMQMGSYAPTPKAHTSHNTEPRQIGKRGRPRKDSNDLNEVFPDQD